MHYVCSLLASVLLLCQVRSSFAWKPVTHVYLAQEAWEDAKDGKVTLYRVDYETGAIGAPLGEFAVSPDLLAAIRAYPAAYFAGVIGPDAYPDMVTGQMRVHPPGRGARNDPDLNENGPGTPPWLSKLWTVAFTREPLPQVKAFVAGYLAHAAGDVFAHTYINGFTGGIFDLKSSNGLKHVVLEGYVEKRTPALRPIQDPRSSARDPYDVVAALGVANGVDRFIARHTAEIQCPTCDREEARFLSLPWNFVQIRNWLGNALDAYNRTERELRGPLGDWVEILADAEARVAWACDMTKRAACPVRGGTRNNCPGLDNRRADVFWCGVESTRLGALTLLSAPIEPALVAWRTFTTTVGPLARRAQAWRENIDEGLARWVQTNHRIAMNMFFNRGGMNMDGAMAEIRAFAPIAAAMLTGFDVGTVVKLQEALNLAKAPIDAVSQRIDAVKADFYEKAFLALIGTTPRELQEKYLGAHAFIDPLFGAGTLRNVNRSMKLPESADDDFARGRPITRFDWRTFPAAYNTVTLIKLSLLQPSELNRLYRILAELPPTAQLPSRLHHLGSPPDNVMLGWGHTIDGSNQWVLGMPLADHGCVLYRRLFQRIPRGPAANQRGPMHPAEPDDTCTPLDVPMLAVDRLYGLVAPGGKLELRVSEDALVQVSAGSATRCSSAGKPCNVTITAPQTDVPLDLLVTLKPKIEDPRRPPIDVIVHVAPELEIRVVPDDAAPTEIVDAGSAIRPGQRVRLELVPNQPAEWTLEGPGRLIAPKRVTTTAQTVERKLETKRRELAKCKLATCIERAQLEIGKLAKQLSQTTPSDSEAQRIYEAPSKASGGERVVIRAKALDGRTASIELTLRQPPIPVKLKNANLVVKAGGVVELEVDPPVPVAWTLPAGALGQIGEAGTAEHKQLETHVARLQERLRTVKVRQPQVTALPRVIATPAAAPAPPVNAAKPSQPATPTAPRVTPKSPPAPRVPATSVATLAELRLARTRLLASAIAEVDQIVQEHQAPVAALLKLRRTYRAPAKVTRPTTVVVTGVVQDGSGRKLEARIRIEP